MDRWIDRKIDRDKDRYTSQQRPLGRQAGEHLAVKGQRQHAQALLRLRGLEDARVLRGEEVSRDVVAGLEQPDPREVGLEAVADAVAVHEAVPAVLVLKRAVVAVAHVHANHGPQPPEPRLGRGDLEPHLEVRVHQKLSHARTTRRRRARQRRAISA